jgi:hypothetical protein
MACNGCDPDTATSLTNYGLPYVADTPWWDTSYCHWGVLLFLIVLTALAWGVGIKTILIGEEASLGAPFATYQRNISSTRPDKIKVIGF